MLSSIEKSVVKLKDFDFCSVGSIFAEIQDKY